jgi:hypothetical protein
MNVYLISSEMNNSKIFKIGFTRRSVEERIRDFTTGNVSNFSSIHVYNSIHCTKIEKLLHKHFSKSRIGKSEWFNLTPEDIKEFIPLCERYHNTYEALKTNTYLQDKLYKKNNKNKWHQ